MFGGETSRSRCGDDTVRSLAVIATTEKEEIRHLNDRLGDMFVKLERARLESNRPDNSAFLAAIAGLQEEVKKLRATYEAELTNLRRELERALLDKNDIALCAEKFKSNLDQLQKQYGDSCAENARLRDELAQLRACLALKDNEVVQLSACLRGVQSDLELLRPKATKYEQDNDDLRRQLDQERRARLELEDKLKQALSKAAFDSRQYEQHVRDLNDRDAKSREIIDGLNEKLRITIAQHAAINPNLMLNKLREDMARELADYKRDTEESVRKALAAMKERMEKTQAEKDAVVLELARQKELVGRLQGQINELEGQLAAAVQSNRQLQVLIQNEKAAHARAIEEMERKLSDLQECIMEKVHEVAQVREVQASLQAEIKSYRALLDEGEMRLASTSLPPLGGGTTSGLTRSYTSIGYPIRSSSCASANRISCNEVISGPPIIGNGSLMCQTHCARGRKPDSKFHMGGLHRC